MTNKKDDDLPGVPASIYLDRDECGDPRVVANTNAPRKNDPMARHVRRVLEKL